MTDEKIAEAAVEVVGTDARKDVENTAKQHMNSIWHTIETWTIEKLDALIADLKKHV